LQRETSPFPVTISYTIGPKVSIKILYKIYLAALCFYQKIYNIHRYILSTEVEKRVLRIPEAVSGYCCFLCVPDFPAASFRQTGVFWRNWATDKQYKNIEKGKFPIYIYSFLW